MKYSERLPPPPPESLPLLLSMVTLMMPGGVTFCRDAFQRGLHEVVPRRLGALGSAFTAEI